MGFPQETSKHFGGFPHDFRAGTPHEFRMGWPVDLILDRGVVYQVSTHRRAGRRLRFFSADVCLTNIFGMWPGCFESSKNKEFLLCAEKNIFVVFTNPPKIHLETITIPWLFFFNPNLEIIINAPLTTENSQPILLWMDYHQINIKLSSNQWEYFHWPTFLFGQFRTTQHQLCNVYPMTSGCVSGREWEPPATHSIPAARERPWAFSTSCLWL